MRIRRSAWFNERARREGQMLPLRVQSDKEWKLERSLKFDNMIRYSTIEFVWYAISFQTSSFIGSIEDQKPLRRDRVVQFQICRIDCKSTDEIRSVNGPGR